MRTIKYLTILSISAVSLFSCRKVEQLPPVPKIEFTSFAVFDTTDILGNNAKAGRLKFHFEDGDGDLGLKSPTGNESDTTNMYFTLFRKRGGVMDTITNKKDPLLPYSSYRIPYMEKTGVNKILKGTISVTFLYLFYSPGDTIKYDFFIRDRALNESNVASTSEIVISVNKVYTK